MNESENIRKRLNEERSSKHTSHENVIIEKIKIRKPLDWELSESSQSVSAPYRQMLSGILGRWL